MKIAIATICLLVLIALPVGLTIVQPAGETVVKTPTTRLADTVTVAEQLRLKRKLLMGDKSLASVLRANRRNWDAYTPEQRRLLRQRAYAFRNADPDQRRAVIDAWSKFFRLTGDQKRRFRQRAAWLKVVRQHLSAEKKAELLKMLPAQRAAELLRLKAKLQAEGKLPPDKPAAIKSPTTRPVE